MFKKIIMGLCLLVMPAQASEYHPSRPVDHANASISSAEKSVREAAVKITVPFAGGHGSGSYIKYKDIHIVISAAHVTNGRLGTSYLVTHKDESRISTLIYLDPKNDISILYVGRPFRTIKPMKFNPAKEIADVGTEIIYSGYPSDHKLLSFVGRVAGYEPKAQSPGKKEIILQTYGWFGCSGSIIYNLKGQQVGVLYGVDMEYYPGIQVQENMIWVAPIDRIKMDKALGAFCRGYQGRALKACR
jgi:hypothetical protein